MNIIQVLDLIKHEIESTFPVDKKYLVSKGNENGFEKLVSLVAQKLNNMYAKEFKIIDYYGHHFPDLGISIGNDLYGVELKSRNNGSWGTNGNSVLESISEEDYKEIYLLFGTHNSHDKDIKIQVKYAPYWKVTSAINVTHSPRFKINMDTEVSVFKTANEYYSLREKSDADKVSFLQEYLKEHTSGVKWFVSQNTETLKPITFSTLTFDQQEKIKSEFFVLFPQDLLKTDSNGKANAVYNRSFEYLLLNYYSYSASFRDLFSAGGKWNYKGIEFPQVVKKIHENRRYIIETCNTKSPNFRKLAYQSWSEIGIKLRMKNFLDDYKTVLNYVGNQNLYKELQASRINLLSNIL